MLFSIQQLSKQLNLFIQNTGLIREDNKNEIKDETQNLEYNKNDQLISKSESNDRIIILLLVIATILSLIFQALIITAFISLTKAFGKLQVNIPIRMAKPYLQTIDSNGSIMIYEPYFFINGTFEQSYLVGNYSLPILHDFYFSYEYRKEIIYLHGKTLHGKSSQINKDHCYQSVFQRNGQFPRKKVFLHGYVEDPTNSEELIFDDDSAITANGFIMQVQAFIWFFGGGFSKNTTYDLNICESSNPECNNDLTYNYVNEYDPLLCKCTTQRNTQLWSNEKYKFVPMAPSLPKGKLREHNANCLGLLTKLISEKFFLKCT